MGIARLHKLRALLALVYLLIGVSAAWHAPHFSQGRGVIGVDHHVHHEAVFGDECALCAMNSAPQLEAARFGHNLFESRAFSPEARRLPSAGLARLFTGRPRAPPSLLS